MTVVDANLLLYAYNADAPQHAKAARWFENLLTGSEPVALPWMTIHAFLRLSTNARVWPNPMGAEQAIQVVQAWLEHPDVQIVDPGPRHLELLERLVVEGQAAGSLLADATLAAIAVEFGATLASADRDFARFEGLRWVNPLA